MRAFDVLSVVLPDAGVRPAGPAAANMTPGAYNPCRGERVQLAWLRYSTSQRPAARPYGRPARLADPACPVRPAAACR
ncbi:hypothetical protein ABTY20_18255 [Streptomyces sp. NPDC126497]|uniref:hypothetical protein n=1 Tax=Streptomyces sp. NPDC126497 TaxID=3155313 RepID=UPI003331E691